MATAASLPAAVEGGQCRRGHARWRGGGRRECSSVFTTHRTTCRNGHTHTHTHTHTRARARARAQNQANAPPTPTPTPTPTPAQHMRRDHATTPHTQTAAPLGAGTLPRTLGRGKGVMHRHAHAVDAVGHRHDARAGRHGVKHNNSAAGGAVGVVRHDDGFLDGAEPCEVAVQVHRGTVEREPRHEHTATLGL